MGKILRGAIFACLLSLAGAADGHAWFVPDENTGVTSANVRMWFVREAFIWMEYEEYRLLNLNQFERYIEFHEEIGWYPRIMFTTEATVRNFSFLKVDWEPITPGRRSGGRTNFSVNTVLYTLPELTPDAPFVTDWGWWQNSEFDGYGFSFTDETGVTRYFSFFLNRDHRPSRVDIVEF